MMLAETKDLEEKLESYGMELSGVYKCDILSAKAAFISSRRDYL